MYPEKTNK
ncbi:hypothetical protein CGLO_14004 [Colletotrichum gloeosporioides Cg-14]|uniref:Uncharacterized protein n=1 Tax=Colletotrichum gloeosporioides (strain Cg-14) TaxID=1237896 RepID=T0JV64_COLGC|nr:hypothetical protein CGLO_14004 [Colletotrichum gloeosporioides Cg-14]